MHSTSCLFTIIPCYIPISIKNDLCFLILISEHKITDGNQTNMQEEERNEHNKSPTEEKRRENTEMEKDVLQNTLNKIEDESISLQLRIDMLNDSINSECTHLSSTPLKDYERLQYLKQIMSCSNNVCKKVEDTLVHMNSNMVRVNQSISEMKKAIDKKMSSEGLLTWAEQLKTDPSGNHYNLN